MASTLSRTHIPFPPSQSLFLLPWSLPYPACSSPFSTVDGAGKMSLWQRPTRLGKSLTHPLFLCQRNHLALSCASGGAGGGDVGNARLFLSLSSVTKRVLFFFFSQQDPGTFSLETCISTRAFLLVGDYLRQGLS